VQPPCGWAYRATLPNAANKLQGERDSLSVGKAQKQQWRLREARPPPLETQKQGEALKLPCQLHSLVGERVEGRVVCLETTVHVAAKRRPRSS